MIDGVRANFTRKVATPTKLVGFFDKLRVVKQNRVVSLSVLWSK